MSIWLSIILIIMGFILLIKGADFLVEASCNIAKKFHIPEIVIGLTIVSIGTSLPELIISLNSTVSGNEDISVGNVIGSNICNLLLILGLAATIRPLKFKRETRLIEIPMCLILTIIFAIFCNAAGEITRQEAMVLLILFSFFIIYTIVMGINGEKFDKEEGEIEEKIEEKNQSSMLKNLIYIILGIVGLKIGGDLVVENSTIMAEYFNISQQIISLTIVSIGTSLPELVTSAVASVKGNSDISIGNILGSNIFNLSLIVGISAIINPIRYNYAYNFEMAILLDSSIILAFFPIISPKNKMTRKNGVLFLGLYILYNVMIFKI